MEQIGEVLLKIYIAALWLIDHWEVLALIGGPALPFVYSYGIRFTHALSVLKKVRLAMQDHVIGDTEAATLFWMLVTVLIGFWPKVNEKVLDACPDQQIALLKGYKFISAAYRPEIAATENGK